MMTFMVLSIISASVFVTAMVAVDIYYLDKAQKMKHFFRSNGYEEYTFRGNEKAIQSLRFLPFFEKLKAIYANVFL